MTKIKGLLGNLKLWKWLSIGLSALSAGAGLIYAKVQNDDNNRLIKEEVLKELKELKGTK